MFRMGSYWFKVADTPAEFAQIHQLNYRTFVREIPQHADDRSGQLVDKFHEKNRYLVALRDETVVGMLSAHDAPPFSVTARLPDPTVLTAAGVRPVEIRLLAVEPAERNSPVLSGLVWALYQDARERGYTHFVISGVTGQLALYEHLGFVPLGPPVAGGAATFVPMWLPVDRLEHTMGRAMRLWKKRLDRSAPAAAPDAPARPATAADPVCLLPGPVAIAPAVTAAFHEPLVYHRSEEFRPLFEGVRGRLGSLVGGKQVAVFVGSGTLANDAVAVTLAAGPRADRGLMLVSGEFGDRLARQARRSGLAPRVLTWDWGQPWDLEQIDHALKDRAGGWVWGAHHETSTGLQNDLAGLLAVAARHDVRVCLDCVSSLGTVPVDLTGVYLASGASGKALGSLAGLSFVFADPAALTDIDTGRVPTYLDVPATLATEGPRFTVVSPLVRAMDVALAPFDTAAGRAARFRAVAELGGYVRQRLVDAGLRPLVPASLANPSLVTFAPPPPYSAAEFVAECRRWGYQIGGQSGYLAERGLVQIAVMGAVTREQVDPLLDRLDAG